MKDATTSVFSAVEDEDINDKKVNKYPPLHRNSKSLSLASTRSHEIQGQGCIQQPSSRKAELPGTLIHYTLPGDHSQTCMRKTLNQAATRVLSHGFLALQREEKCQTYTRGLKSTY